MRISLEIGLCGSYLAAYNYAMCGRYSLSVSTDALAAAFRLAYVPQLHFRPRFNIAPSQQAPVVRLDSVGKKRELHMMQWGLIPSWADDPKIGNRLINARAESAAEKPAFRSAFRKRRCLVPADGFYEWLKPADKGRRKIPHMIRMRDGSPFAFAGLWESWRGEGDQNIESFTILTTEPNELTRTIHNRMPVILSPDEYDMWLDPDQPDVDQLTQLLNPAPAELMTAYPVSPRVNSPANDDAACMAPASGDAADAPSTPAKPSRSRRKPKAKEQPGDLLF